MLRYLTLTVACACIGVPIHACAQQAVRCHSVNRQYNECWAGPMRRPVVVQQTSGAPAFRIARGATILRDQKGNYRSRNDCFYLL